MRLLPPEGPGNTVGQLIVKCWMHLHARSRFEMNRNFHVQRDCRLTPEPEIDACGCKGIISKTQPELRDPLEPCRDLRRNCSSAHGPRGKWDARGSSRRDGANGRTLRALTLLRAAGPLSANTRLLVLNYHPKNRSPALARLTYDEAQSPQGPSSTAKVDHNHSPSSAIDLIPLCIPLPLNNTSCNVRLVGTPELNLINERIKADLFRH